MKYMLRLGFDVYPVPSILAPKIPQVSLLTMLAGFSPLSLIFGVTALIKQFLPPQFHISHSGVTFIPQAK
jgi:hypothetical protein